MSKSLSRIPAILVAFVKLVADFHANVRIEANITTGGLYRDILSNGLDEPLVAEQMPDGTYLILQGHRRYKALVRIMNNQPDKFSELFPEGVPVRVLEGLTDQERTRIRADHGNVVGLTKGEVAVQFRDLRHKGLSKPMIQVRLFDQLCDVAKKRLYRSEDPDAYGTEDAASDVQENAYFQAQIGKLTGLLQTLSAAAKMPQVIFDSVVCLLDNKPGWTVFVSEAEVRKFGPIWSKDVEAGCAVDEEGFTPNLRKLWGEYKADPTRSSNEDVRKAAKAAEKAKKADEEDAKDDVKPAFEIAVQIQAVKSESMRRILVAVQKGDLATIQSIDNDLLKTEKAPKRAKAS